MSQLERNKLLQLTLSFKS